MLDLYDVYEVVLCNILTPFFWLFIRHNFFVELINALACLPGSTDYIVFLLTVVFIFFLFSIGQFHWLFDMPWTLFYL